MSRYDSNAHIPKSNMSAYITSTPKAPLDPGTAEFIKGKPRIEQAAKNNAYYIGRLQQHLDDFDRDLADWKASGEWKKDYKTWGVACEVALGISRCWADRLIKRHNASAEEALGTIVPATSDTDKARELETLNALPDLMADFDADLAATVHAGPAPRQAPEPVPERQPRERTDNGKPIYAMPVWREMEEGCGKLINRVAAANDLSPNKEKYQRVRTGLLTIFDEIQSWHEMTRKL